MSGGKDTNRSHGWRNETRVLSLMIALRVNAKTAQEKESSLVYSLSSITGRFNILTIAAPDQPSTPAAAVPDWPGEKFG